jgi:hypothetical protein
MCVPLSICITRLSRHFSAQRKTTVGERAGIRKGDAEVPRIFFNCGLALAKRQKYLRDWEMGVGKCKYREIGVNLGKLLRGTRSLSG